MVPSALRVFPGGIKKLFDFCFAEEIPGPFVALRRPTFFHFLHFVGWPPIFHLSEGIELSSLAHV
jgi:hypothetical protein